MSDELEEAFVASSQRLHAAAQEAASAKKLLIERYICEHHPGVSCQVSLVNDNLLSLDVSFSGIDRDRASKISNEVSKYLQILLDK